MGRKHHVFCMHPPGTISPDSPMQCTPKLCTYQHTAYVMRAHAVHITFNIRINSDMQLPLKYPNQFSRINDEMPIRLTELATSYILIYNGKLWAAFDTLRRSNCCCSSDKNYSWIFIGILIFK
jgi:hypothetical protein